MNESLTKYVVIMSVVFLLLVSILILDYNKVQFLKNGDLVYKKQIYIIKDVIEGK